MRAVARALALAVADALAPRMLAILFVPALASLALWSALAWGYWGAWTAWIEAAFAGTWLARWSAAWGGWLMPWASGLLAFALFVPAVIVTAIVVTEAVAMPVIVSFVGARHYPYVEKRHGGSALGSALNTLVAVLLFLALWLATFPLWFTVVGAVLVPAVNSAYLNQRLFRYDALAEHASAAEYRLLKRRARAELFLLGLALACLYYVPVVNLLAPVLAGLAYTHLCLDALGRLRSGQRLAAGSR